MRGFSKAIIAGNITSDPELRTIPSGNKVCGFSVAVNRVYKDANGENKDQVSYIECSAWGKAAENIAKYTKKGSPILVSGRLNQRSWDDKETGKKRHALQIVVEDFSFISSRGDDAGASVAKSSGNDSVDVIPDDVPDDAGEISLDEVPF